MGTGLITFATTGTLEVVNGAQLAAGQVVTINTGVTANLYGTFPGSIAGSGTVSVSAD